TADRLDGSDEMLVAHPPIHVLDAEIGKRPKAFYELRGSGTVHTDIELERAGFLDRVIIPTLMCAFGAERVQRRRKIRTGAQAARVGVTDHEGQRAPHSGAGDDDRWMGAAQALRTVQQP